MFASLLFVLYLLHVIWRGTRAIGRALVSRLTGSSIVDRRGRGSDEAATSVGKNNVSAGYQGFRLAGDQHSLERAVGSDPISQGGYNIAPTPHSLQVLPSLGVKLYGVHQGNLKGEDAKMHQADPQSKVTWKPPSFLPSATHVDEMQIQRQPLPPQPPSTSSATTALQYGQGPGPPTRLYGGHNAPPHVRRPGGPPPRAISAAHTLLPPHVAPGFRAQGRGIPGPPRGPPPMRPPSGGGAVFGRGLRKGASSQPPFVRISEEQKNA
jgi:hypothetical protein